jgi:hypothetical protein
VRRIRYINLIIQPVPAIVAVLHEIFLIDMNPNDHVMRTAIDSNMLQEICASV